MNMLIDQKIGIWKVFMIKTLDTMIMTRRALNKESTVLEKSFFENFLAKIKRRKDNKTCKEWNDELRRRRENN